MNVLKSILVGVWAFFVTFATESQGTFRNMDFGLSQVPSTTSWGTQVPVSQAFPFWAAYYGANQVTTVVYNAVALGSVSIGLLTPDDPADGGIPGHNTAVIQAGSGTFGPLSAALAQ